MTFDLVALLVTDVGEVAVDELHRQLVQLPEVVRAVRDLVGRVACTVRMHNIIHVVAADTTMQLVLKAD